MPVRLTGLEVDGRDVGRRRTAGDELPIGCRLAPRDKDGSVRVRDGEIELTTVLGVDPQDTDRDVRADLSRGHHLQVEVGSGKPVCVGNEVRVGVGVARNSIGTEPDVDGLVEGRGGGRECISTGYRGDKPTNLLDDGVVDGWRLGAVDIAELRGARLEEASKRRRASEIGSLARKGNVGRELQDRPRLRRNDISRMDGDRARGRGAVIG